MSQSQNGISSRFLSQISSQKISIATQDDGEVVVNNIIATAGLVEVGFKEKALMEWAKPYLASVKVRLEKERPDRVEAFMKGAQGRIV